jgi:SAM-dependent methyltransferase
MKKLVFNKYSEYYDLIYNDKNYSNEVNYIHETIQKFNPGATTILDIGCGTGIHANLLASLGYKVHGIDFSESMIEIANDKLETSDYKKNSENLKFSIGDLRYFNLEEKFDVVLSLFHVLSYLNTNQDVLNGINTINNHLNQGGIAIFDFWHGPGVLTDLPLPRKKMIENSNLKVTRFANPTLDILTNTVLVHYDLLIYDKKDNKYFELNENHSMRYFFKCDFEFLLKEMSPNQNYFFDWLSFENPTSNSWTACVVLVK